MKGVSTKVTLEGDLICVNLKVRMYDHAKWVEDGLRDMEIYTMMKAYTTGLEVNAGAATLDIAVEKAVMMIAKKLYQETMMELTGLRTDMKILKHLPGIRREES